MASAPGTLTLVVLVACTLPSLARAQSASPPEGWAVLPVDEYRALRDRTLPPRRSPTSAIDATLTRVDYELRADGESVTGTVALTIDVLRDGWVQVPVPAGLMARAARLDGQPVSLVSGPAPYVMLPRSGRSTVTLDVALPLQPMAAGADAVVVPKSQAPMSRVALTVPRTGIDLSVEGGFTLDRSETNAESRWTVIGTIGQPLTLSWKRKLDDRRAAQPLRLRAHLIELVGLGEETGTVTASIRVDVMQGVARDVVVAVPPGLAINQVNGPTVADWTARPDGLHVTLLEPTTTDAAFVVTGESRVPRDGSLVIPLVRVPMAERETGAIAVDVVGAGEIASRQSRNLEPGDPSEVGDIVAGRESPSMIAFRLRPIAGTDERTLSVSVVRYTPQAVLVANIEEARYRALASEDGRVLVEARYAVRNNQRSFLKATLPAGATLWSASVADRPVRPAVAGVDAVLLPLQKGRAGEEAPTFVVSMVYLQPAADWKTSGRVTLTLPALDLPVSRTGLELRHSPRITVTPRAGAFRAEADSGPTAEALRQESATTREVPSMLPLVPAARDSVDTALGAASGSLAAHDADATTRSLPQLQALVERYQRDDASRTVIGTLPVSVAFPTIGPSLFLASELTAEGRFASVDLDIKRVQ